MGVEPTSQPWEGRILPMKYTRRTYILYQSRNQKSRGLLKKYEVARILYVTRPHIRKIRQNNRAENKKRIMKHRSMALVLQSNDAENQKELQKMKGR